MSATPLYCFCFTPGTAAEDAGLDDCGWETPVRLIPVAGLGAAVSEVTADVFTGPAAEERLADINWLVPRASAHDRIITRLMDHGTVFPLRFGTLFSSRAALATEVAGRRGVLNRFFTAMAGREEWAFKVLLDREQAVTALVQQRHPGVAAAASGREYLLQQRRRVEAERALDAWLAGHLDAIEAQVAAHCEVLLRRPAVAPALVNHALLLRRAAAAGLLTEVARLAGEHAAHGLQLHCSGPWPLYSFVSVA